MRTIRQQFKFGFGSGEIARIAIVTEWINTELDRLDLDEATVELKETDSDLPLMICTFMAYEPTSWLDLLKHFITKRNYGFKCVVLQQKPDESTEVFMARRTEACAQPGHVFDGAATYRDSGTSDRLEVVALTYRRELSHAEATTRVPLKPIL